MKFRMVLLLLMTINSLSSAHFYPNFTSVPASLLPNASAWYAFKKLAGCHNGAKSVDGLNNLKKYFRYFGYLNSSYNDSSNDFDATLEAAVKTYQLNFNLNATGELDAPTLAQIVRPRCGNPDAVDGASTTRRRASSAGNVHAVAHYSFFPGRPRWPAGRTRLTYAFLPENGVPDGVRAAFRRAFGRWAEVTPLTFAEADSYYGADIRVGFYIGDHGDGEPFDGVLGTLAHAFSPPAGRLHLDGDEAWVVDGGYLEPESAAAAAAVDLESVAVHEIGHLLGLGHSSVEEAIMYPTISTGARRVELAGDDIEGIQELYGSNPNYNGSTGQTPREERDMSGGGGAPRPWRCRGILLLELFLFSLLLLFV
ncbi:matrix metalloproteinase [Striga asiatica]|uniref:Matrix metalloproteinase n=1 Tax=Striga asiatica TaxID=4170 RepID=A0A5A7RBH5_STRAF|nr:matrix metalloproteinase [Striga asiatica]